MEKLIFVSSNLSADWRVRKQKKDVRTLELCPKTRDALLKTSLNLKLKAQGGTIGGSFYYEELVSQEKLSFQTLESCLTRIRHFVSYGRQDLNDTNLTLNAPIGDTIDGIGNAVVPFTDPDVSVQDEPSIAVVIEPYLNQLSTGKSRKSLARAINPLDGNSCN
jgi:hypothetical protein